MAQKLKIGYFEHWFQPPYKFVDFLSEQKIEVFKIDFSKENYLEGFDVVFVEQHGFNDFIENDEEYIREWVSCGGIFMFMHQDYMRWAPYFLPEELGHVQLIHRYIPTINPCVADKTFTYDETPYMTYMMPWIERPGKKLFSEPETITPDEMIDWRIQANTFGVLRPHHNLLDGFALDEKEKAEYVRATSQSCYLPNENWEVLGSFMDCAVKDGGLILRGNYGKGMYFLNQILFPEVLDDKSERCLSFWKKYVKNLIAYFSRFKNGESEDMPDVKKELPIKRNYKVSTHMHSLDWYGCDSHPGTINAMMRYMGYDICSIAVKDAAPYDGNLDVDKYSDDKVLFLHGQEYHPFNYNDRYEHLSHNTYHFLAVGIDPDAYTTKFTRSLFSDEEIDAHLKEAADYIHANGGAVCAAHPNVDYWKDYDIDSVDKEPLRTLAGEDIEKYWLSGRKLAISSSVDLFGFRRILDNPATNFIYLNGEKPCRDSVVKAIRNGHVIAACGFDEADIFIGEYIPGDEIPAEEVKKSILSISAKVMKHEIKRVRVYSDDKLVYDLEQNAPEINLELSLNSCTPEKFIRVEVEGLNEHWICLSTPFYIK